MLIRLISESDSTTTHSTVRRLTIQILKIRNYPRLMTKQARTCLPRDLSGIVQVAAA